MSELTETSNRVESHFDGASPMSADRKRHRRRRTRARRFVPYTTSSPEADAPERKSSRRRSERKSVPMAPSNTTQFLLEDREARAEADQEAEHEHRHRLRTQSESSDHQGLTAVDIDDGASCSGEGSDQEVDQDFATDYLEAKRARITQMSKSELEEELLERSQDTETLQEECEKIQSENKLLKELLQKNGIDFDQRSKSASPTK